MDDHKKQTCQRDIHGGYFCRDCQNYYEKTIRKRRARHKLKLLDKKEADSV